MKKTDLFWLLGWPVYQILGTARHELSHAAVAVWQGATIKHIEIFPSFRPEGFFWGYVSWTGGQTNWLVSAAPYWCDLAVFLAFLPLCAMAVRLPRWLWINLFIVGMISPLVDIAANYTKLFRHNTGDLGELAARSSPFAVHAVALAVIAFYLWGIWFVWRTYHRRHPKIAI
jgi:hypothetical protein